MITQYSKHIDSIRILSVIDDFRLGFHYSKASISGAKEESIFCLYNITNPYSPLHILDFEPRIFWILIYLLYREEIFEQFLQEVENVS